MPEHDPDAFDDDNPELTDAQLAGLKPASAVFTPRQLAALAAAPILASQETTVEVRLRVSSETLAAFQSGGPGWESRMRTALERAAFASD